MRYTYSIIIFSFFIFSCMKEELPVAKRRVNVRTNTGVSMPGELIEMQVEMGADYKSQVWFSLNESKVIYTNNKKEWDLSFECSPTGYHVLLNGSKAMRVYKTNFENLKDVTDTSGIGSEGSADMPSGNLDSTAVGNWVLDNKVYLVNRGYDEKGQSQGFYKLKLLSVNATQFTFEYSDIKNKEIYKGTVNKDQDLNYRAYSFTTHSEVVNVEPKKDSYDLCFTQYTHLFVDPPQYYQVTGVLANSYKTRIMKIMDKAFNEITIDDTLHRRFSIRRDQIGFDWKEFNLNTNIYTVFPSKCYVISDNKHFFYKLHFTGFVNKSGLKGYPTFEFQKL
jgi:hypothetical protein